MSLILYYYQILYILGVFLGSKTWFSQVPGNCESIIKTMSWPNLLILYLTNSFCNQANRCHNFLCMVSPYNQINAVIKVRNDDELHRRNINRLADFKNKVNIQSICPKILSIARGIRHECMCICTELFPNIKSWKSWNEIKRRLSHSCLSCETDFSFENSPPKLGFKIQLWMLEVSCGPWFALVTTHHRLRTCTKY